MSRLERLYSPPEIGAPGKREARGRHRDLFTAGLFVLAMAAIAIAALTLVIPGLFGGTYRLHAYFLEATGLKEGIQVIQDGYVIGLPPVPGRDTEAALCPPPPPTVPARSPVCPVSAPHCASSATGRCPPTASPGSARPVCCRATPSRNSAGAATGLLPMVQIAAGREPDVLAKLSDLSDALAGVVKDTIAPALASIKAQVQTIETLLGTGGDQGGNRERLAGAFESLQKSRSASTPRSIRSRLPRS